MYLAFRFNCLPEEEIGIASTGMPKYSIEK